MIKHDTLNMIIKPNVKVLKSVTSPKRKKLLIVVDFKIKIMLIFYDDIGIIHKEIVPLTMEYYLSVMKCL